MASVERLTSHAAAQPYRGTDRLVLGIVLAVITFRLFAVSITALFSGIFIIVAGDLADRFGRVMLTYVGLGLSVGSLLIAVSPSGTATFLIAGRVLQGLSAACIMPATLAS